jgi:hypothetical protein
MSLDVWRLWHASWSGGLCDDRIHLSLHDPASLNQLDDHHHECDDQQ